MQVQSRGRKEKVREKRGGGKRKSTSKCQPKQQGQKQGQWQSKLWWATLQEIVDQGWTQNSSVGGCLSCLFVCTSWDTMLKSLLKKKRITILLYYYWYYKLVFISSLLLVVHLYYVINFKNHNSYDFSLINYTLFLCIFSSYFSTSFSFQFLSLHNNIYLSSWRVILISSSLSHPFHFQNIIHSLSTCHSLFFFLLQKNRSIFTFPPSLSLSHSFAYLGSQA